MLKESGSFAVAVKQRCSRKEIIHFYAENLHRHTLLMFIRSFRDCKVLTAVQICLFLSHFGNVRMELLRKLLQNLSNKLKQIRNETAFEVNLQEAVKEIPHEETGGERTSRRSRDEDRRQAVFGDWNRQRRFY